MQCGSILPVSDEILNPCSAPSRSRKSRLRHCPIQQNPSHPAKSFPSSKILPIQDPLVAQPFQKIPVERLRPFGIIKDIEGHWISSTSLNDITSTYYGLGDLTSLTLTGPRTSKRPTYCTLCIR